MTTRFFHLAFSGFIITVVPLIMLISEAHIQHVNASPVKITEVVTSPDPFVLGKSALTLAMLVELPARLKGDHVLEVSAMITSPTRRSMSFVAHRRLVDDQTAEGTHRPIPIVLVWDGKDQSRQLVSDGSYYYELQAKLMVDQGNGPRTKIVSRRVHGTLEALAYPGEILPPLPPEPDVPEELEILQEEEPFEEDNAIEELPIMEDGLQVSDEPVIPGEEMLQDAENPIEEHDNSGIGPSADEPEGHGEMTTPEMPPGAQVSFFAKHR